MLVSTDASSGQSIAYGKAIPNNSGTIPAISENGFGQDISSGTLLTANVPTTVVLTTTAGASSGPATSQNIGGLNVSWGRWDKTQMQTLPTNNAALIPINDLNWALFIPTVAMPANGTYRYATDSSIGINGIDHTGNALRGGVIEFNVNFAGGVDAISNGLLQVFDSRNATWRVTFNGNIVGAFATMTDITGTVSVPGASSLGNVTSGAIGGVFTGTGPTPAFVNGFSIKSGSEFIQGMTLLNKTTCITSCVLP
jgi:hypothetical protein